MITIVSQKFWPTRPTPWVPMTEKGWCVCLIWPLCETIFKYSPRDRRQRVWCVQIGVHTFLHLDALKDWWQPKLTLKLGIWAKLTINFAERPYVISFDKGPVWPKKTFQSLTWTQPTTCVRKYYHHSNQLYGRHSRRINLWYMNNTSLLVLPVLLLP